MPQDEIFVRTVNGNIPVEELGITLFHEHLFLDARSAYRPSTTDEDASLMKDQKVSIENLALLREYPYACLDNCLLDDPKVLEWELLEFTKFGGNTIVEVTAWNSGRAPDKLLDLSKRNNIHIIMGCGLYLERTHSAWVKEKDETEIAELIVCEAINGVRVGDRPPLYPGVIGEVGISKFFSSEEKKGLRAAARAQVSTGLPLVIHLPGWERFGHEVLNICEEIGVNPESIVLAHMDPSSIDPGYQFSLAERKAFLEFDGIGMGLYLYREKQAPCDDEIAKAIIRLIERGFGDRILLSHDVYLKILWRTYGGNGYGHILRSFVPRLVQYGIDKNICKSILVENPQRVFVNAAKNHVRR